MLKIYLNILLMVVGLQVAYSQVFITEITDPLDDFTQRFVEICNTGNLINISNYSLRKYSNGNTSFCSVAVPANTTLNTNDCFIFYNSTASAAFSNCVNVISNASCVSGNGNDVYELFDGINAIDRYGVIGQSGGTWDYLDSRVVRNNNINIGTTNFNLSDWTIFSNANAADATPCEFINNSTTCGIILETPILTCINTTVNNDLVTVNVGYSGVNANAVVQVLVNSQPTANNGDNPSATANGNIIFQANENDTYNINFSDTDCNTVSLNGFIPDNLCTNYYGAVESMVNGGLRCANLKTELHNLIDNHTAIPYTSSGSFDVLDFMCTYDIDANGNVLNRYSSLQASCNGGNLPGNFNRDHILPSSWWGGNSGVDHYSDLFNLYPSESSANSAKNNYSLGEVAGNIVYTSTNNSLVGDDALGCITSYVFEPNSIYKGDFARSFFYMATRYEDIVSGWETQTTNGNYALTNDPFTVFEPCLLNLLLQWHQADPVSQLEIDRNEDIFGIQGNRNPFVDHPEYVGYIWNTNPCNTALNTCFADACSFNSVSVQANSSNANIWNCNTNSYSINPFCGVNCTETSEQWLISDLQSFPNASVLNFSFNAVENFNGPDLEIVYSTNYNGANTAASIAAATWLPLLNATDDGSFSINLINQISQSDLQAFYIGIKHTATGGSSNGSPPGTGEWTLTNLNITGDDCSGGCPTVNLQISGLPSVSSTTAPISLIGNPAGGSFSGNGIVFSAFNPSISGPGNHTITYTYNNGGCSYTTTADIFVFTIVYNFVNYNLGTIAP